MLGREGVGLDVRRPHLPAAGDPGGDLGPAGLAARLVGLLRAVGRGAGLCPTCSPTTSPATARRRRWRSTATGSSRRAEGDRPTTFLTANVVVADTDAEAERLARPQLLAMLSRSAPAASSARSTWSRRRRQSSCPPEHEALLAAMRRPLADRARPSGWPAEVRDLAAAVRRRRGDGAPGRRRLRGHRLRMRRLPVRSPCGCSSRRCEPLRPAQQPVPGPEPWEPAAAALRARGHRAAS